MKTTVSHRLCVAYLVAGLPALVTSGCNKKEANPKTPSSLEQGTKKHKEPRGMRKNRGQVCGVYLDGEPLGFLSYPELPRGLEPIWVEEEEILPFKPGEKPKTIIEKYPRYRFVDYLAAHKIPIDKVRALHLHHGRGYVAHLDGKLLKTQPNDLLFRFGSQTFGKSIPEIRNVETNAQFDHMVALSIYVDKPPPKLNDHDFPMLDGKRLDQHEIPYFGPPMRRGIRVYKDDRLQFFIKRRRLSGNPEKDTLANLLVNEGLDPTKLKQGVLIARQKRGEPLDVANLLPAFFEIEGDKRVVLQLGSTRHPIDAIALYSSP